MARLKHKLTEPPVPPARGVKAATFRLLLDTAMSIIHNSGHIPSVAEVAVIACFKFTGISFLWYNLIGCALVMALALLAQAIVGRTPRVRPA